MTSRLHAFKRPSSDTHATRGFEDMIQRLIRGASELQGIESSQVDAIIDPATGRVILLPEAQEALRADQARDRSLVRLSSDWQWEKDKHHRFVSCEGPTTGSSAFEDKTIVGKRLWDLPFDNMSNADWRAHRNELKRHSSYRDLELRCRDQAGTARYFSVSGEPIYDQEGGFKGYRGIARDISNFKLPEAGSQESTGIARATLDALPAQICVLDSAGTVILANRAWRTFAVAKGCTGIGVSEGSNFLGVCDNAGEAERANGIAIAAGIRQVIARERELFRYEYAYNSRIGKYWFVLTVTGFPGNGPGQAVLSHERTTRRKRAEQLAGLDSPAATLPIANSVLAAVPRTEYQRLAAGLEPVSLTFGDVLYEPGGPIRYVYFPGDCLISLLTQVENHMALEVGLVGSEGMVGIPLALGIGTSSVRALVQGTGTAMRMEAGCFQLEFKQSPSLQRELYRYTHLLMAQFSQTAACNRFHVVEARLARWLLMTRDRVRSNEFHLTHEFLADMLGVQRVGVTNAASALRERKLIDYSRGNITILNPKGLSAASCGCYRIVKDLFDSAQR
jgi:CRP-like cAMP-binding protein/PAS domain-containing protein